MYVGEGGSRTGDAGVVVRFQRADPLGQVCVCGRVAEREEEEEEEEEKEEGRAGEKTELAGTCLRGRQIGAN